MRTVKIKWDGATRNVYITWTCDKCGQEFTATSQTLSRAMDSEKEQNQQHVCSVQLLQTRKMRRDRM
jgi:ribosomal protein L37AE/L43A